MNSRIIANGILRALSVVVGILLFLFFLYKIQSVLVYLVIAAVLALVARPIISFLTQKIKLPNIIAVILTMSFFLMIIIGIISMFIPLIKSKDIIYPYSIPMSYEEGFLICFMKLMYIFPRGESIYLKN